MMPRRVAAGRADARGRGTGDGSSGGGRRARAHWHRARPRVLVTNYELRFITSTRGATSCSMPKKRLRRSPRIRRDFKQERKAHLGSLWANCLVGRPIRSPPLSLLAAFDILSVVTVCLSWDTCFFSLVFLPALCRVGVQSIGLGVVLQDRDGVGARIELHREHTCPRLVYLQR